MFLARTGGCKAHWTKRFEDLGMGRIEGVHFFPSFRSACWKSKHSPGEKEMKLSKEC